MPVEFEAIVVDNQNDFRGILKMPEVCPAASQTLTGVGTPASI